MAVTIAIPVYATPVKLLDSCLRSVTQAKAVVDEAFVVVDGPQAADLELVLRSAPGLGFQVVRHPSRLGLVGNWNACLSLGTCELLHVMHADDAVAPGFYAAATAAMQAPNVAIVVAGTPPSTGRAPNRVLGGADAARYLLSDQKPPTGGFVLRRSALGVPPRGFIECLPYCPDEELFLRVLATGDLAIVDDRLYLESRHDRQARYATWRHADFADVYYAARIEGTRSAGVNLEAYARRQTSRRLLGVGRFLCKVGEGRAARAIARSIMANDKRALVDWKYWALIALALLARTGRRSLDPQAESDK